jgi:hypothetical protein
VVGTAVPIGMGGGRDWYGRAHIGGWTILMVTALSSTTTDKDRKPGAVA